MVKAYDETQRPVPAEPLDEAAPEARRFEPPRHLRRAVRSGSDAAAHARCPLAPPCGCVSRWRPSSRSEEHTSELQSLRHLVCRLLLEKKNTRSHTTNS